MPGGGDGVCGGVSCGIVVVEERDARGSSVRRSRRTGTLVHATPCAGGVALELVGEAGVETYLFHKGSCRLFRSFVRQGKLTVCTAGMRHQIMMSEAEPALLTELCAILMGENNTPDGGNAGGGGSSDGGSRNNSCTRNARKNAVTATKPAARCNRANAAASIASSSRRWITARPSTTTAAAVIACRGAAVAASGGPLGPRSVNTSRGSSLSRAPCSGGGDGVGPRASNTKGRRADDNTDDADGFCYSHTSTTPGAGRASDSGGRGGAGPARKSTRKVSPKKSAEERRRGCVPRELALSEDQQRAVDLVVEGRSVFFTGA
ncbi:unnamed protein product, partial [Hapterophycus canaliculatus]